MSAGKTTFSFVIDTGPFVEALERLADALDPMGTYLRTAASARDRGEVLCGRPHTGDPCPRCRAAV